jgi:putative addiction module killer protein
MSIRRLEAGNFGAAKPLQDGVIKVRMDFGPGYRVYYGREWRTLIVLARRWNQTAAGR